MIQNVRELSTFRFLEPYHSAPDSRGERGRDLTVLPGKPEQALVDRGHHRSVDRQVQNFGDLARQEFVGENELALWVLRKLHYCETPIRQSEHLCLGAAARRGLTPLNRLDDGDRPGHAPKLLSLAGTE